MKNIITGSDFINLCKKKSLSGGYLFFDDEEYMKRHCVMLAKKSFGEGGMGELSLVKIDCEDDREWLETFRDSAETSPLFSEEKIIYIQDFDPKASDNEEFYGALSQALSSEGLLVIFSVKNGSFDPGRLPKSPSPLLKRMGEHLTPVRFERESPARLNTWVGKKFASEGIICDAINARAMVEYVSPDMSALASECEKLTCYIKSRGENKVTEEYIYKVCVPMKPEGEFALSNALIEGDYVRCMELVTSMRRRKERPEMIFTQISSYVNNMYIVKVFTDGGCTKSETAAKTGIHEFRVGMYKSAIDKRGISAKRLGQLLEKCNTADRKIKTTSLDSYTVLENLVYEVCS